MAIKNYTTSISVNKTIGEIQALLAKAGASAVMCNYNYDGLPSSIAFRIETPDGVISYQLPARIEKVYSCLCHAGVEKRYRTMEHAGRVGWRIVKDWVSAQLAFIESEMVTLGQVFLPYAQNAKTGQTVYEMMEESRTLLLN